MLRSICLFSTCLGLIGCGSSSYEGPQRHPLTGKVTWNGEPVDGGTISFIPQAQGGRPSGGVITKGEYSVPEEKGPHAGAHRVEIRWYRPTGKQTRDVRDTGEMVEEMAQVIPARYNQQSELTAEVSEIQTNFDFGLAQSR